MIEIIDNCVYTKRVLKRVHIFKVRTHLDWRGADRGARITNNVSQVFHGLSPLEFHGVVVIGLGLRLEVREAHASIF